jgi:hypothetical protein
VLRISDSAIGKKCFQFSIPKPQRGYWRRLEVGEQVEVEPLDAAVENRDVGITVDEGQLAQIRELIAARPVRADSVSHPVEQSATPSSKNASVPKELAPKKTNAPAPRARAEQCVVPVNEILTLLRAAAEYDAIFRLLEDLPSRLNLSPAGKAVLAVLLRDASDTSCSQDPKDQIARLCEGIANGTDHSEWWPELLKRVHIRR